jgi:hypothetical protein
MSPEFTPPIPFTAGGLRLVESSFDDATVEPSAVAGIYPPNGRWSYEEFLGGGGATEHREVVVGAGFVSTASDEAAALGISDLIDCLPFSVWEFDVGCTAEELAPLREMRITSMTVGESGRLKEVAQAGGFFFPKS